MVDRQLLLLRAAISAFEPVPYENIFLAERDPASENSSDEFYQLHDGRDFHQGPAGSFDKSLGIRKDLNLSLGKKTDGSSPVYKIKECVIRIQ